MVGIINCTNKCNLACRYCFEENWKEKNLNINNVNEEFKKSLDMFINFSKQLCEGYPDQRVDILLHGGEPLLIDINLLESFFQRVSEDCTNVRFLIQTNGTILSEKHIQIFKKYNVLIGFSIDGSKECHNKFRVDKGGKGTHEKVLWNLQKLKENGLNVGGLATFTGITLDNIESVYKFFRDNKIDFSFNPFFIPSDDDYSIIGFDEEKYAKSICKLFDLWIEDKDSDISITAFERILDGLTNKENQIHGCSSVLNCSENFVAIDVKGNIYTCNHFCGNEKYSYAHFNDGNIVKTINEKNPFKDRWNKLKESDCKDCNISNLCYGGCPYHSLVIKKDINKKDFICNSQKIIITHIYDYITSKFCTKE